MTLHRTAATGLLYAEDFDVRPPPPSPPPRQAPVVDVEAACDQAVQAAWANWLRGAEARRTEALEALAAGLAEARAAAAHHAELVADGIARTALGMVAGLLPRLCHAHGDAEVRALLGTLLPLLDRAGPVVVRAHAGLLPDLQAEIDRLDGLDGRVELRPANLPPGDVRLSWEDGTFVRDAAAIGAAMRDGLAQLGLLDPMTPQATTPTRSLAIAE